MDDQVRAAVLVALDEVMLEIASIEGAMGVPKECEGDAITALHRMIIEKLHGRAS